jgi:D-arginine dehydrogenase
MGNIYDFMIIGGGIAGASIGSELAKSNTVILVDQEEVMGYHTTGRSAAISMETYGSAQIRALTRASSDYFRNTTPGGQSLINKRGALFISDEKNKTKLVTHYNNVKKLTHNVQWLEYNDLKSNYPFLSNKWVCGIYESDAVDIDVNRYHQYCLKKIVEQGSITQTNTEAQSISRENSIWKVTCNNTTISAKVIVNAAGAWADQIAELAGISTLGIKPLKRSALLIDCLQDFTDLPYIADINESFYFKPDAGLIMMSPCDETLSPPCDIRPDPVDIAESLERFKNATNIAIKSIKSEWAGLRTFSRDRNPIIGFDHRCDDFFWLAGQGGYGIQTAPAITALSRSLLCNEALPHHLIVQGIDPRDYSPERFF